MGAEQQKQFPCGQCGGKVEFKPGAKALKCPFCGSETAIPQSAEEVQELDFEAYLAKASEEQEKSEQVTVNCGGCGAATTLAPNVTADKCPFCGAAVVAQQTARTVLKPKALLPFRITGEEARKLFRDWLASRWFAPNELKLAAGSESGLQGLYVPYWIYDCNTTTFYWGERGDDYWDTETYTTTENGRTVTRTRQVRKTRWRHVSGWVWNRFDDLLILASRSLPKAYADELEPWDLKELTPYQEEYLSGFRTESYQVGLAEGFGEAKQKMVPEIERTICSDIGGDHQRIHTYKTRCENVKFKHVLLPIWLSAYRFREQVYRFLVNARTGEVQGERPYSWLKITLAVVGGLAAIAGLVMLFSR